VKISPGSFEGENRLPPIMMRSKDEGADAYKERLSEFLLSCDDELFSNVAFHCNANDPEQGEFLKLY
jgi:hypothetical protein